MSFRVAQETLEALEWPKVVQRLREQCRTAQGQKWLDEASSHTPGENSAGTATAGVATRFRPLKPAHLFEPTLQGLREKLQETDEARALLDAELAPPLGATADLAQPLSRAEKGALLEISELVEIASTLATLRLTARFFQRSAEQAPALAEACEQIEEQGELEKKIEHCIDPSGEVLDRASPRLAAARREILQLSSDLQKRLDRYVRDPEVSRHLSDSYYTVRNDRYVLPVKADFKGRVSGIVHDASRSGTTLFVEPEGVIEVNNRLKKAELDVSREIRRVLEELSGAVAQVSGPIRSGLDALARIDLAFARGRLSVAMDATSPQVDEGAVFELPGLRHPLIEGEDCVANDLRLGDPFSVLVLSGPNAGGKTVAMKAVGLAALFVRAGLHVPCEAGARVDAIEYLLADIGDHQDIGESLSTFSAHMANLADIVGHAGPHALIVLDEIGVGTDPGEGAALAQSILESLADRGARVITTTHYNLLKEMADVDSRFQNACVEFDPKSLAPTYRIQLGVPGVSSASAVAARMGMPSDVLARADALLDRDDRKLERMLSELATSRATLASETEQASRIRAEGESVRNDYRAKLERLQERRDDLFHKMQKDLDASFKEAHAEIAGVIRDLQRGPTSQKAAQARDQLQDLKTRSEEHQAETAPTPKSPASHLEPVDWRRARPGDALRVLSGSHGILESLPDRKGRVGVRVGGKKLVLAAEQVGRPTPDGAPTRTREQRVQVERAEPQEDGVILGGGIQSCDLRGERVQAALSRLSESLDRAAADGCDGLRIIHGIGTGALREAVREFLAECVSVKEFKTAPQDEGGEGVTFAELA
ncbi:MAG: Smr/MutS family protein [Myxococcota bacterium]|jgi:DNA mismatch repair protein MutS2|nr:Smr/MutS family protein [Myxococcota bacterium]